MNTIWTRWTRLAMLTLLATTATLALPAAAGDRDHRGGHHGRDGGGPFAMHAFGDPERMLRHMSRKLDLDATQKQNISNILSAAKPEMDALRTQLKESFTALHDLDPQAADYSTALQNLAAENGRLVNEATLLHGRLRAGIHAELTPEQREQLEERMSR